MNGLNEKLLAAHDREDTHALIGLYEAAADQSNDFIERSFFLTHAFVYALEKGDVQADQLHGRLREMGRI